MSKPATLTPNLIAIKGQGLPAKETAVRSPEPAAPAPAEDAGLQPLNFKVPNDFRREFKTYAAAHDLKLNELLKRSFAAYRAQQKD